MSPLTSPAEAWRYGSADTLTVLSNVTLPFFEHHTAHRSFTACCHYTALHDLFARGQSRIVCLCVLSSLTRSVWSAYSSISSVSSAVARSLRDASLLRLSDDIAARVLATSRVIHSANSRSGRSAISR